MMVLNEEITKAYYEAQKHRENSYKNAPTYGTLVDDAQGNRYLVLEASNDINTLEKYDDGQVAKDYASKLDPETLKNTLWLAVSDPTTGKVGVFIFGKGGLDVVVQNPNYGKNDERDVINALKKVISTEGGSEKNIPLTSEQDKSNEEKSEKEYDINVKNVNESLMKILDIETKLTLDDIDIIAESVKTGRIETYEDLYDYGRAISRRAFGPDSIDDEKIKTGVDYAFKLSQNGKNWIPAIGYLKRYFACFEPGCPEAIAYGKMVKAKIAEKRALRDSKKQLDKSKIKSSGKKAKTSVKKAAGSSKTPAKKSDAKKSESKPKYVKNEGYKEKAKGKAGKIVKSAIQSKKPSEKKRKVVKKGK